MVAGGHDFIASQPGLSYPRASTWHASEPLINTHDGILSTGQVDREPVSSDNDAI
jgi:hypothetical protein